VRRFAGRFVVARPGGPRPRAGGVGPDFDVESTASDVDQRSLP
jgi:hypothetical protein